MNPQDLIQRLMQNGQNADASAKSFTQMLQDRSNFVTQTQGSAYGQAANTVQNGGTDGVRISSADAFGPAMQYAGENTGKTQGLYQMLAQLTGQANDAYGKAADIGNQQAQIGIQRGQLGLQANQQGREDYLAGYNQKDTSSDATGNVDKYLQGVVTGAISLSSLPTGIQRQVQMKLNEIGYTPDPKAPEKRNAQNVIDYLEKLYGRGDAKNVGTDKDLSLGGNGDVISKMLGWINGTTSRSVNPNQAQDSDIYHAALNNVIGVFSQALGSGTPQEQEAKRLIDNAPTYGSTNKTSKAWFTSARNLLSTPEMKILEKQNASKNEGSSAGARSSTVNGFKIEEVK